MKPLLSLETQESENMSNCILMIKGVLAVAVLSVGLMVVSPTSEAADTGRKKAPLAKKVKKPRAIVKNTKKKNVARKKLSRQARQKLLARQKESQR
jgi:hypothetical protein